MCRKENSIMLSVELIAENMCHFGIKVVVDKEKDFQFKKVQLLTPEPRSELEPDVLYIGEPKTIRRLPKKQLQDHFFVVRTDPKDDAPLRAGINALLYDEKYSLGTVTNHLLSLFDRLQTFDYQMRLAASANAGLGRLLEVGKNMLPDATIVIVDSTYNIIAASRDGNSGNDYVDKVLERGYYDKNSLQMMSAAGYFDISERYTHPLLSLPPNVCNDPVLLRAYTENGTFFSFAGCYFPGRIPTMTEEWIFRRFTDQLDCYYRESGFYSKSMPRRQQKIHDLLSYGAENPELVRDRARGLHLPEKGSFRLGCIELDEAASAYRAGYMVQQLHAWSGISTYGVFQYKNDVLILFQDWHEYSVADRLGFGERWGELLAMLRKNRAHIGVSLLFTELWQLRIGYDQAKAAIDLGQRLDPNEVDHQYSKYYLNDMLEYYRGKFHLDDVAVRYLDRLSNGGGSGDLMLLYYYLSTERNISLTAKQVHMHRNSVIYRLQRIQNALNLDLDDPNVRLRLMISFEIFRMQGKLTIPQGKLNESSGGDKLILPE